MLACAAVAVPSYEPPEELNEFGIGRSVFWSDRPSIAGHPAFQMAANAVEHAEGLTVYEGPPRWRAEGAAPRSERDVKPTFLIGYERFYPEPMIIEAADVERLRQLCRDAENFRGNWPSTCGGFHADYGLRWSYGGREFDFLLCFGCGEAKLRGPCHDMYFDMHRQPFEEILGRYPSQRPVEGGIEARRQ